MSTDSRSLEQMEQVFAGSIGFGHSPKVFQIVGLGSCIAVCFYAPKELFGALAHVMLPSSEDARTPEVKGKYADTAIPELLSIFQSSHIAKENIIVKLVGGSSMFPLLKQTMFDVATKNFQAIKTILEQYKLPILKMDIGGNAGRSIKFFLETGEIHISQLSYTGVRII